MRTWRAAGLLALALALAGTAAAAPPPAFTTTAARDPGVRTGAPAAGTPLPGLTQPQLDAFTQGLADFQEVDSVQGALPGEVGEGLGPRFNLNSCAGCHAQPAVGGSSPFLNPQVNVAGLDGAQNTLPWFVTANGPIREMRYRRNPDGSPDGGVHALFVISGRADAGSCAIAQPSFGVPGDPLSGQGGDFNIIFRIPTPLFGAGLLEAVDDATILANLAASASTRRVMGVSGRPNRSGNDGTITRFGWKAQNKSIRIFSGEAYNVEQGVSNALFPQEREETAACRLNATPEDHLHLDAVTPAEVLSDVETFTTFAAFLAPPAPAAADPSITRGAAAFQTVGCALCHTPTLTTGPNAVPALANQVIHPYTDLALHAMGAGLADGISQGGAGPAEFRTAPLWGLGQRVFFLHDGRTADLVQAIRAHAGLGSEANGVVASANALSDASKQDLLNFLRSL